MFTNVSEYKNSSSWNELFLFSAKNPLSNKWKPHPKNPIISSAEKSRPAGKIFSHNNKLIRPSQNCLERYGHSIVLNEIIILNEDEYKERFIKNIEPNWSKDIIGFHTINNDSKLTVSDVLIRKLKYNIFKIFSYLV